MSGLKDVILCRTIGKHRIVRIRFVHAQLIHTGLAQHQSGSDGKVLCPSHADRHAMAVVCDIPDAGWFPIVLCPIPAKRHRRVRRLAVVIIERVINREFRGIPILVIQQLSHGPGISLNTPGFLDLRPGSCQRHGIGRRRKNCSGAGIRRILIRDLIFYIICHFL